MHKKSWDNSWKKTDLVEKLNNLWDLSDKKNKLLQMLQNFMRKPFSWPIANLLQWVTGWPITTWKPKDILIAFKYADKS